MTDRYHTLTVALKSDMRSDDAQALIEAIGLFEGVLSVSGNVSNPDVWLGEQRARHELGQRLLRTVYPAE